LAQFMLHLVIFPELAALFQQFLIVPCSTIRPCSSTTTLSARTIVDKTMSDRNHCSTYRKLF
jgi:hypothetical protein